MPYTEREARAALSWVTEPADTYIARLVKDVGAPEALERLMIDDHDTGLPGLDEARRRVLPRVPRDGFNFDLLMQFPGLRFVTPYDSEWPTRLNDLDAPPFGLWVRGQRIDGAFDKSVSIVGARAATSYGEHVTRELTEGMVRRGYVIVSGAAYGIDGMAHRTAVTAGGKTIAFLAGGVDRMYPAGHQQLAERIIDNGALISEVPPGSSPTKWRFLTRNRLIAAASEGSVVVEAGWRSGSLNEAGHARSIGRPVGAVPGPITSAASAGCHRLIDEGASIITSADDIVRMIEG